MVGTTLGVYRIDEEIGRGGMGRVYRAHDTALNRDVAIKVLPDRLGSDPDRLLRFEREAQTLAALNHPNIAHVYGLEKSGETPAIVMELVEGPTLADRIAEGPIPLDEALLIARQIAEGLEAAHERGIIHRDLKPANIKVRDDRTVKVIDFGLAKALAPDPTSRDGDELANVPTMTARATQLGVVLGTAAYMAPEQAKGKPVDKRVDVWAFGVVLYEMLTGKRPFGGEDIADVLAAVVRDEPDWSALPADTPLAIEQLLRRCLEKRHGDRLHDIGDARLELTDSERSLTGQVHGSRQWLGAGRSAALLVLVVVAGCLLAVGYWIGRSGPPPVGSSGPPTVTAATEVNLPDGIELPLGGSAAEIGFDSPSITLSPDGTMLAFTGTTGNVTQLYIRRLGDFGIEAVPGSEGAIHPFFSPDGESLGFLTNSHVKKVSLRGGLPQTLCSAATPVMATWTPDGAIYFTTFQLTRLWRVEEDGTNCREVAQRAVGREYGAVLPSGRWALVVDRRGRLSADYATIQLLSLETSELRPLVRNGYGPQYVETGQILFGRAGTLYAVPFDEAGLVVGDPVPVADEVRMDSFFGVVQAAASATGTIAYVPGGDAAVGRIAWVGRDGSTEFLPLEEGLYGTLDLSPDGNKIAVHVADVSDHIVIHDLERNESRKLPTPQGAGYPVWSPDGTRIAYRTREESDLYHVLVQDLSDPDSVRTVFSYSPPLVQSVAWHPDGAVLALVTGLTDESLPGIGYVAAAGARGESSKLGPLFRGIMPWFSPDGTHLAYSSEESGQMQVYVRSYLDGVLTAFNSGGFGIEPRWCDECGSIFFRRGTQILMAATQVEPAFSYSVPVPAFETAPFVDTPGLSFDITADGQRILVVKRAKGMSLTEIHVLQSSSTRHRAEASSR